MISAQQRQALLFLTLVVYCTYGYTQAPIKLTKEIDNRLLTSANIPANGNKIYHLAITAEQFAPNIILVGDPDRAPLLADNCLESEDRIQVNHRGLCTITGKTKTGLPVSIITSGMGTPSTEIVINELIILNEIDLETRTRREKPLYKNLHIIRLGTCGGLQETRELGSFVITEYALGLDNTGLFYSSDQPVDTKIITLEQLAKQKLNTAIDKNSHFYNAIHPYAAAASPEIVNALSQAALEENIPAIKGITLSNSGFFANQGRDISRFTPTIANIDELFADFTFDGIQAENMEMETSFLCHFAGSLGYHVGAICLIVAHRPTNTFFTGNYNEKIIEGLNIILKAFEVLNQKESSVA